MWYTFYINTIFEIYLHDVTPASQASCSVSAGGKYSILKGKMLFIEF